MARKRGKSNGEAFNEEALYDQFPESKGEFGPRNGFATNRRLNDPDLFTDDAKADPVIRAFLEAPFSVWYAQYKSSTRESEYALHKPLQAMTGKVRGIKGNIDDLSRDNVHLSSLIINHDLTMARYIWRSVTFADGTHSGQMIHKEEEPTSSDS